MRRLWLILGGIGLTALVCIVLPPFRVVPLKRNAANSGVFEPSKYAEQFWSERVLPALAKAPQATAVLAALADDPAFARTNFGRTMGMSDTSYYLMRGTGTVCSVAAKTIGVSLAAGRNEPDLALGTGLLFGNTVRDATGLLDPAQFPNSQDFNDISAALNRIVENRVIPELKKIAAEGRRVRFVVAAEIESGAEADRPIRAVPMALEIEQP